MQWEEYHDRTSAEHEAKFNVVGGDRFSYS